MEMEEVFLQLCREVARLQELCSEQGRLLQKLRARKGPGLDIPVSLPIQCTEDAVTGEGERSPESHQKAPTSSTSHLEGSAHPMEQLQAPDRFPGSTGDVGTGGAATAFPSTRAEKGNVYAWMRSWILPVPRQGGRAPRSPRELEELNPGAGGSFPNLLDLYDAPEALGRQDPPREGILPAEAPVEVRGPVKTSWTPGWTLEEGALGHGTGPTSEAALACDLCQEIFPSDPAGHTDYLNHILAHLE